MTDQKQKTWQQIQQAGGEQSSLAQQYLQREKVIDGIRAFFKLDGFHEVETPLLVKSPGTEPYLEVFATQLEIVDGRKVPGYLLTSPEFAMKKLLVAGLPKIFQVCKSFRNGEGIGSMHNHEFTILEWYRAEADYQDIMADCEQLFLSLVEKVRPGQDVKKFEFQGRFFDVSGRNQAVEWVGWPRRSVSSLFREFAFVNDEELTSDGLITAARRHNLSVKTWDDAFNLLFMNLIEPQLAALTTPIFVYDYPVQQAALAKRKANDPRFAERFELYFAGIELANAFSELTDAAEQEARFRSELQQRQELGKTKYDLDTDFISALQVGMPESGGVALGVDRLIMILANTASIKETLLFPIEEVFDL